MRRGAEAAATQRATLKIHMPKSAQNLREKMRNPPPLFPPRPVSPTARGAAVSDRFHLIWDFSSRYRAKAKSQI
ncbi:hypothetical protein AXK12_00760 [Cephaloticoccus capnophilus]|uniref:Uncharacterized protein n=1 Tax=Cephaloticoccus capnophilus TaxID=1548208 RepID=A0A139SU11_9BACT|nr:hypothetical protein AXK12_00760 [Cephaloticoccus capnophilus]